MTNNSVHSARHQERFHTIDPALSAHKQHVSTIMLKEPNSSSRRYSRVQPQKLIGKSVDWTSQSSQGGFGAIQNALTDIKQKRMEQRNLRLNESISSIKDSAINLKDLRESQVLPPTQKHRILQDFT